MNDMGDLGPVLKRAREAKGSTLPAAAASTKIKIDYLQALESLGASRTNPRGSAPRTPKEMRDWTSAKSEVVGTG